MPTRDIPKDFTDQDLSNYLYHLATREPCADASQLTLEEEQELLNILGKLHNSSITKIKCMWSILAFYFSSDQKKRSGFILMTLFHHSNISSDQFSKVTFKEKLHKVIEKIPKRSGIEETLEIVGISPQYFYESLCKWKMTEDLKNIAGQDAKWEWENNFPNPILQDNEYDSDPDTIFYQHLLDAFDQSEYHNIHQNLSCLPIQVINIQDSIQWDNQETISMKRKPYRQHSPYFGSPPDNQGIIKKKKKGKRPKRKERKQRNLNHQKKIKQKEPDIKIYYEKKKRQNYLQTKKKKNTRTHRKRSQVYKLEAQAQIDIEDYPNINSQIYFQDLSDQVSDLMYKPFFKNVQSPKRRRLKKKNQIMHRGSNQGSSSDEGQQIMEIEHEFLQDKFEDIQIRPLDFGIISQDLEYSQFMIPENFYRVRSQRQIQKEIKHLAQLSCQPDLSNIQIYLQLQSMAGSIGPQKSEFYLKPLMENELIKNLSLVISRVVQLLTVSSEYEDLSQLHQASRYFLSAKKYLKSGQELDIFCEYSYKAMKSIIERFSNWPCISAPTISLIEFGDTRKYIQPQINMNQIDQLSSICVSIIIIDIALLRGKLASQNGDNWYLSALNQCFSKGLVNKCELINKILQIYQSYKVPLSLKLKESIPNFAKAIDLTKYQPQSFFSFLRYFDALKIQSKLKEKPNPRPLFRQLTLDDKFYMNFDNYVSPERNHIIGRIRLEKCQTILSYPEFHGIDILEEQILIILGKYKYTESVCMENIEKVFLILNQLYELKFKTVKYKDWQNTQKDVYTPNKIEGMILEYFENICEKYENFLFREDGSVDKKRKICSLKNLITEFINGFIQRKQYDQSIVHYFLSVRLLFSHAIKLLLIPKIDQQLAEKVNAKLFHNITMLENIEELLTAADLNVGNLGDQDDQYQQNLFFARKNERSWLLDLFRQIIKQNKFNTISKLKILSLEQMEQQRNYYIFRLQGLIFALGTLSKSDQLTREIKLLDSVHCKQAKLINRNPILNSNIQLALEFIYGLVETCRLVCNEEILKSSIVINQGIILDIIFIGQFIGEKQRQQSWKILSSLARINKRYKLNIEVDHFYCKFCNLYKDKFVGDEYIGPQLFEGLKILIDKNTIADINFRFNTKYKIVLLGYHKLYSTNGWNYKRSYLAINLLKILVFLLSIQAQQSVITTFQPYFIIIDPYDPTEYSNILKLIHIKEKEQNAKTVISCFTTLGKKHLYTENIQRYAEYIVQLEFRDQEKSANYSFPKRVGLFLKCDYELNKDEAHFSKLLMEKFFNHPKQAKFREFILHFLFKAFQMYPHSSQTLLMIFMNQINLIDAFCNNQQRNSGRSSTLEQIIIEYILVCRHIQTAPHFLSAILKFLRERADKIVGKGIKCQPSIFMLCKRLRYYITKLSIDQDQNLYSKQKQSCQKMDEELNMIEQKLQKYERKLEISNLKNMVMVKLENQSIMINE